MSKYLPVENIVYKTKLSAERAIEKLDDNIEAKEPFGFGTRDYAYSKPYIGWIFGNRFEIERAISYRNSFLPQIKGEVYVEFDGTKIKVSMKPHIFVLIFMAVWFGGIFIACFAMVMKLFADGFSPEFLIPFGMLLFGIALLFGAFKSESSRSKKDLMKILEAEVEQ